MTNPVPGAKLIKRATGIAGFDAISGGGLPEGRLAAIMGAPGAGKTVFALQTLVNRARHFDEGGIFVSFEEPPERLRANANGFNWGFEQLDGSKIIVVDGRLSPDLLLSGGFDLSGLLAQIGALADQIGATSVVFDGIDIVLGCLADIGLERRELLRIDLWVLQRGLSCLITGKRVADHERDAMRQDCLNYLTDVVVEFDNRLFASQLTRVLRIVKYRGSNFAANVVPTVITDRGIEVITPARSRLSYPSFAERLTTGVAALDRLLDGGYRRGTSILVSGAPGTAKTNLAGHFIAASCAAGKSVIYVSFDESDSQILHDLGTIGIHLAPYVETGRLIIVSLRASSRSPDSHFVAICALLAQHRPACLVLDPISALISPHYPFSHELAENLLDEARSLGVSIFCTALSGLSVNDQELTVTNLSTIVDTWMHLTYTSRGGERNRALTIVKSRGTAHSNQVRELLVGPGGLDLAEVYTAEGEVLMGSARAQRELLERQRELEHSLTLAREELDLAQSLKALELQIEATKEQALWKRKEIDLLRAEADARAQNARRAAAERLRLRGLGGQTE